MSKILEIRDHKNNLYTVKTFYKDVEGLEGQLTSLKDELNLSITNNVNKVETSIAEYVKDSISKNNTSLNNQIKDLKEEVESVSTIKDNIETIVEVPLGKYRINAGTGLTGGGLLKNNPTLSLDFSNKVSRGSVTFEADSETAWRRNRFKMDSKDCCIIFTSKRRAIIYLDRLLGFGIEVLDGAYDTDVYRIKDYDPNRLSGTNFQETLKWPDGKIHIEQSSSGYVSFGIEADKDSTVDCSFDWFLIKRGE